MSWLGQTLGGIALWSAQKGSYEGSTTIESEVLDGLGAKTLHVFALYHLCSLLLLRSRNPMKR